MSADWCPTANARNFFDSAAKFENDAWVNPPVIMKSKFEPRPSAVIVLLFCWMSASPVAPADRLSVRVISEVKGAASPRPLYTANRAPLVPGGLIKLPIGSITPKGRMRHQLELQAHGIAGRWPE